jgi:phenylalanyl-tRNA synthetase beta chain
MNILIPHTWLLDHLETDASPQDIQRLLSLSGPSVERIYEREGEAVYDIEVTTNRVDAMSVRGIAREAAVILQQAGIPASLKPLQLNHGIFPAEPAVEKVRIHNDPALNKRVLYTILTDINRAATPNWMGKRLVQTDMNIHDAVIDITNYVTHELGYPCHAFDYDKLMAMGGDIHIVQAEAGETFTTLDGQTYTTQGGEVVFKNTDGTIIDLPSIKGTLNSSVDDSTRAILLLSEAIDAKKVRFASMTHAIRTMAAQLMEKNADPTLAEDVLTKAAELYATLCQATVASPLVDQFALQPQRPSLQLQLSDIERYLGIVLPTDTIVHILDSLGCEVAPLENGSLAITAPTYRQDLQIPADYIEELARIYGYHNLPSRLMDTPIPTGTSSPVQFEREFRIKTFLANRGWQEVYTYSMVSEELTLQSGFPVDEHLKIQNPLTEDGVYLRRSLIPSLLEVLDNNPTEAGLQVFEIARVYHPRDADLPQDTLTLALVSPLSVAEVRGVLEALLRLFYIDGIKLSPTSETAASILIAGTESVGTLEVLPANRVAVQISMEALMPVMHSHPTYQPMPQYEAIIEDFTFTLPDKTPVGNVLATIQQIDPLVASVVLKDTFNRNHTFTVTYLDRTRSLATSDIEIVRRQIVSVVESTYQAPLVGAL